MNSWYFVIWFSQHARSNLCSVVVAPCSCFCGGKPGKDWNSHLDFTVWEIFEKSMHSASQDAQVCLFTSTPSIDAWHVQSLAGIELSVATSRWQAVTLDQGLWRLILHDSAKYSILNSFLQMFHDFPLNILHIPSPDMLGDEIFPRNTAPSQPSHMLPRSSDRLMEPCLGAPVRMVMGWASIATRCYQLFDVNICEPHSTTKLSAARVLTHMVPNGQMPPRKSQGPSPQITMVWTIESQRRWASHGCLPSHL